jgi:hypothetical protein
LQYRTSCARCHPISYWPSSRNPVPILVSLSQHGESLLPYLGLSRTSLACVWSAFSLACKPTAQGLRCQCQLISSQFRSWVLPRRNLADLSMVILAHISSSSVLRQNTQVPTVQDPITHRTILPLLGRLRRFLRPPSRRNRPTRRRGRTPWMALDLHPRRPSLDSLRNFRLLPTSRHASAVRTLAF